MEPKKDNMLPSFSFSPDLFGPKRTVVDWKCLTCGKLTIEKCLGCRQAFCSMSCSAGGYVHHRSCVTILATHTSEPRPDASLSDYEAWEAPAPGLQPKPSTRQPKNRQGGGLAQARIDRIREEAAGEREEMQRASRQQNKSSPPPVCEEKKNPPRSSHSYAGGSRGGIRLVRNERS